MKKKNKDLDFLFEIGSLRHLNRTWTQFLRNDVSNVAEHMFRVAWIALIIAKHEKVKNTEKILKMALVHDVSESRTGDVHYLSRQYNIRNEPLAMKDIFHGSSLEKEYIELWKEYEDRKTIEAKIVKDADNLDVDMELKEQPLIDERLRKEWSKIRSKAVYSRLFTKTARRIWKEIQSSNPHRWHLEGRNRFLAGDWKEKVKRV